MKLLKFLKKPFKNLDKDQCEKLLENAEEIQNVTKTTRSGNQPYILPNIAPSKISPIILTEEERILLEEAILIENLKAVGLYWSDI